MSQKVQQKRVKKTSKNKLMVNATKQQITAVDLTQRIIVLEWTPHGEHFINDAIFLGKHTNIKIHIFFRKSLKEKINIVKLKQSFPQCLVLHESLTDSEEASWTDLLAFLINFYTKSMISCHHCVAVHPEINYQVILVTNQQTRYEELLALLKSNKTETRVVDGWKSTILDLFENVCHQCHLIFATTVQADHHDHEKHNFLCDSKTCERSIRENGFFSKEELEEHKKQQQHCEFCELASFCDVTKYEDHMTKFHVLCLCSCDKYYKTTEDYIEHYCSVFPLPCLEVPECESRFKNIDEQAFHHKSIHGSSNPYFCIACYSNSKLICVKTSDELMGHVTNAKHAENDFNVVIIPETPKQNAN